VVPIVIPPLRDRPEDVAALAPALLADAAERLARPVPALSDGAFAALRRHPFPGNVRELRNVLERALVRCRGPVLDAAHLDLGPRPPAPSSPAAAEVAPLPAAGAFAAGLPLDLDSLERLAIAEALRRVGGNRTHAARLLGIGLRTLRNKLRGFRDAGVDVEPAVPAGRHDLPGGTPPHAPGLARLHASAAARGSQESAA
jgi:DNA-binding NtrC family response regulator